MQTPSVLSDNINGNIAAWTNMTISTVNAAIGYAGKAYNSMITSCSKTA